ncbi:MAG: GlsB/YeaQ/YmgE family stress response membrane protein [bacterium]
MSIFWVSIVVGLIAGYLAKRRGEGPYGLVGDLIVGVVGAFLAAWIYPGAAGLNIGSIVVASAGAVVLLWGIRVLTRHGPMTPETAGKLKFGVWALIGGAIISMIVGFAWGGWTTAGTTRQRADEAVLATRAAICVAQFMKDPNHQARLKELKDTNSWERAALIEKGGWDRMPGEEKASYTVSRACADGLEILVTK